MVTVIRKEIAVYFSVSVLNTKILVEDSLPTSSTGDGTTILSKLSEGLVV